MIEAIVAQIKAQLHDNLKKAGSKRLPTIEVGEAAAKEFKSPPSIVFVPVGETITPPVQGGEAPAIATRRVEVWARVYDRSITACEVAYGELVDAIQECMTRGSYDLLGGEWDTSGKTADGQVFAAKMAWKIPLTRAADKTVVLIDAPITAEINAQVEA